MSMHQRQTGWLTSTHHQHFKVILLHSLTRFRISCPVYCLMPDHAHLLWIGISKKSNQLAAIEHLRRAWNAELAPIKLQKQAYDNVLRDKDREHDAFAQLVTYILNNPVRQAITQRWQDYPYSNCSVPGYPKLDPRKNYFWENFWKAYLEQTEL